MMVWMLVPVIVPFNPIKNPWQFEHPPLDYARYGEYPRFLSAPGEMDRMAGPRSELKAVEVL